MSQVLPPCAYRAPTDRPELFYCRHTQVAAPDDLVPPAVCRSCQFHLVECTAPRPLQRVARSTPFPSLMQQAWNVFKAVSVFVADGFRTVSSDDYQARLNVCETCSERIDDRCVQCGCHLSVKAQGRAFECPLGKWPNTIQEQT